MISLDTGIVFIICGFILFKYPPENVNGVYGYKTPFSMKNKDVWNVAQKYGGISMMILGLINAIIGIWSIFKPLIINNRKIQELFLLISVIVMIIVDEIHLRKVFNKDGSRKGNIIN